MQELASRVEAAVIEHYATSGGFNGISLDRVRRATCRRVADVETAIRYLVAAGRLNIVFGDIHPNPDIKAFPDEPIDVQLEKLSSALRKYARIYPTPAALKGKVQTGKYRGHPFTLRLARGEPQLAFDAFDPVVLLPYRDDPRYIFHNSDAGGWISVRDEFYQSGTMYKRDQILLRAFGFCFNEKWERAVAAYLYHLSELSPEHQQNWNNRKLKGKYKLHQAFWQWSCGEFPDSISIFGAVLEEIRVINRLSELMGKAHLFKDEFEERPSRFTFLLAPTQEEFDGFLQVLDKIVVENIDEVFFSGDVDPFAYHDRGDGVVERERKRPIKMLEEWLANNYRSTGPEASDVVRILRKVRKLRNKPAHVLKPNIFEPQFFESQRQLMLEVHDAVRTLRMIFHTDHTARSFELPRFVDDGSTIYTR